MVAVVEKQRSGVVLAVFKSMRQIIGVVRVLHDGIIDVGVRAVQPCLHILIQFFELFPVNGEADLRLRRGRRIILHGFFLHPCERTGDRRGRRHGRFHIGHGRRSRLFRRRGARQHTGGKIVIGAPAGTVRDQDPCQHKYRGNEHRKQQNVDEQNVAFAHTKAPSSAFLACVSTCRHETLLPCRITDKQQGRVQPRKTILLYHAFGYAASNTGRGGPVYLRHEKACGAAPEPAS